MGAATIAPMDGATDRSDGALVEAHLSGDRRAFDVLYRRHHDRLVQFCWEQTHDLPLAEDLAQEAMIRYLRKADSFDTSRPMWPWLRMVARNLVIDHYRRTGNDPNLDPNLGSVDDASTASTLRLDRIEERSQLGSVLALLPERQRVALRLHHAEDWTTADVADYLEIKVNACKQLLYRARKNARTYYEELAETAEGAFSVVLLHPIFLAFRERFHRTRSWIETLAADLASITIALDAIAERAGAALAVVATIALAGVDASFAMERAAIPSSGSSVSPASGNALSVGPARGTSGDTALRARSPARPTSAARYERTARFSRNGRAAVPGVTSVSGSMSYGHSDDETGVYEEVTIDLGPYSPVNETTVTVRCDESGVVYDVACTGIATAGDLLPEDDSG